MEYKNNSFSSKQVSHIQIKRGQQKQDEIRQSNEERTNSTVDRMVRFGNKLLLPISTIETLDGGTEINSKDFLLDTKTGNIYETSPSMPEEILQILNDPKFAEETIFPKIGTILSSKDLKTHETNVHGDPKIQRKFNNDSKNKKIFTIDIPANKPKGTQGLPLESEQNIKTNSKDTKIFTINIPANKPKG